MIIETETAIYSLDLIHMRLRRIPRDEVVETGVHELPAAIAALRKDHEEIPFEFLAPLEVGKPAKFLLQIREDGVQTVRTTTDVLSVSAGDLAYQED